MTYIDNPTADADYEAFMDDVTAMGTTGTTRGELIAMKLAHAEVLSAQEAGDPYRLRNARLRRSSAHTRLLVAVRSQIRYYE
ncbi:hypothetical protein ABT124_15835 [Streptomyces sp. NPDC001982]|uniref:hypothetical protein n=1 Tax=Streptomyces sp. NPDC001982 TaxID=3154405 RepID=UPI0033274FD0